MAKWPFLGALLLLLLAGLSVDSALAERHSFSVSSLGNVIVLEEGRKKPLDTYARNKLIQYSGKQRIRGSSALEWMARVLFDPLVADTEAIFLIDNPEIVNALGIAPRPGRRYSFVELYQAQVKLSDQNSSARKTPPKERSLFEKEIIRVNENYFEYGSLSSTFSFFTPHEEFSIKDSILATQLGFPSKKLLCYVDLLTRSDALAERMQRIQTRPMDSLTTSEKSLISLVNNMYQLASSIGNPPPHCIVTRGDSGEAWVSPWGLLVRRHSEALIDKTMGALFQIRDAYLDRDGKQLSSAVREFNEAVKENITSGAAPDPSLELVYNNLGPFSRSKIALGLAALLALIAVFSASALIYWAGMALVGAAWVLVTIGLVLRMLILGHPPLSSLYETFVFVSWLTVMIGMVLEFMRLRPVGLLTASITGFLFLHIAGKFAGDGDTMGMLVAVLDSSFWLTTHIITIALGYAGCIAAGLVAHVYLIQTVIKKFDLSKRQAIERAVYGVLSFGLVFTIVGTILGGMWADQAWGRFWGWDPKENGALLIILWCLTVLHARSAGMIKGVGTAVGAIVGTMLVMCAWIGVNLLGVGLHSYGFASSGASPLLTYLGLEIAFLVAIGIFFKVRK